MFSIYRFFALWNIRITTTISYSDCYLSMQSDFDNFFVSSALLDDLDKELNNYIMRCREWYGWHFPELGKIVTDNLAYCKAARHIGQSAFALNFGVALLQS